jgi:galactokinase
MTYHNYTSYSAPGRVCLYGEHQDYLKLPVIPAAINLRTIVSVKKRQNQVITVSSDQLSIKDEFTTDESLELRNNPFDYLRALLIALYNEEIVNRIPGFDIKISSTIPIGSGLSSSAALLVAWLTALNEQLDLSLTKLEIADLCFKAENQIMGINCGIMDQYSSSLGGIFSLDCDGPPYDIVPYESNFQKLVIGDTQVHRAANEPLTQLKTQLFSGLRKLQQEGDYSLKTLTLEDLSNLQTKLTASEYSKLIGAISIRIITQQASNELLKKKQDIELLGQLLTKQQDLLRNKLGVSIPKLDELVKVSLNAGCLGGKLTGAGLGGCVVILAPENENAVAKAIEKIGGKAYICEIDYSGGGKAI